MSLFFHNKKAHRVISMHAGRKEIHEIHVEVKKDTRWGNVPRILKVLYAFNVFVLRCQVQRSLPALVLDVVASASLD